MAAGRRRRWRGRAALPPGLEAEEEEEEAAREGGLRECGRDRAPAAPSANPHGPPPCDPTPGEGEVPPAAAKRGFPRSALPSACIGGDSGKSRAKLEEGEEGLGARAELCLGTLN